LPKEKNNLVLGWGRSASLIFIETPRGQKTRFARMREGGGKGGHMFHQEGVTASLQKPESKRIK